MVIAQMQPQDEMVTTTIRFQKDKLNLFDEIAQDSGISRSDLLRLCVNEKIAQYSEKIQHEA